jgi:hypothetical protein
MDELYSLLRSFTPGEWSSFRNYLTCFTTYNPRDLKQLKLAEMLAGAKECPSHDECAIALYGTKHEHSFDELKSTLKEKVLDFLLTDISDDKKVELDEADLAIIRMKKKSAQFQQLYYSKKRTPIVLYLLEEIISLAKEYEQYLLLVEHLKAKKNLVSFKLGEDSFEKITNEMDHYSKCSYLFNKAEHYYFELIMSYDYNSKPNKTKIFSLLKKAIPEIQIKNEEIKSPYVKYYLKNLEMDFYQLQGDYLKSRSVCLELLDIVRNNKSVYRRQRVGIVYDHLSRCEYYLGNYELAVQAAQNAQQHFNAGSENYCIALEQEFYALFALKNYTDAGTVAVANRMLTAASRKELGEFRWAKYNYLLACALFKLGRFTETLNLLSQNLEISKDKTGWEIGLRTLKIMALVELNKHAEAELAVLALREFIKYTDKKVKAEAEVKDGSTGSPQAPATGVSRRDRMIFNLLMQLQRTGFMFEALGNKKAEDNLAALAAKPHTSATPQSGLPNATNPKSEIDIAWEPFTHELIPFHEWFAQKMKRKTLAAPAKKKMKREKVLVRK